MLMRKRGRNELARRLLNLGGEGHLARERRLNGEESDPRTPDA